MLIESSRKSYKFKLDERSIILKLWGFINIWKHIIACRLYLTIKYCIREMEKMEQETVRWKQNYIPSSQYKKISSTADRNQTKDSMAL